VKGQQSSHTLDRLDARPNPDGFALRPYRHAGLAAAPVAAEVAIEALMRLPAEFLLAALEVVKLAACLDVEGLDELAERLASDTNVGTQVALKAIQCERDLWQR
jgi:hypothetical protein